MTGKFFLMAGLAILTLNGCGAAGSTRPAGVTASQAAACRQRTDEVFLQQNRGELYRADNFVSNSRDTPFAGGSAAAPAVMGSLGTPSFSAGLSGQYAREQDLNNCYNSTGSGAGGSAGTTPAPASSPSPKP
jgi:hypothetical protein